MEVCQHGASPRRTGRRFQLGPQILKSGTIALSNTSLQSPYPLLQTENQRQNGAVAETECAGLKRFPLLPKLLFHHF